MRKLNHFYIIAKKVLATPMLDTCGLFCNDPIIITIWHYRLGWTWNSGAKQIIKSTKKHYKNNSKKTKNLLLRKTF